MAQPQKALSVPNPSAGEPSHPAAQHSDQEVGELGSSLMRTLDDSRQAMAKLDPHKPASARRLADHLDKAIATASQFSSALTEDTDTTE